MNIECPAPEFQIISSSEPIFRLATSIPKGLAPQLQNAIRDFMVSSGLPEGIDQNGFYHQTLQAMANSILVGQGRDLWLGTRGDELYTYILATISPDFDGRLSYVVSQAWVKESQRGKPWIKEAWKAVRQRAKDTLCSHFAVYSTKGRTDVYCRFLGRGFKKVSEILKEEI